MNDRPGSAIRAVFFDIDGTLISFRNHAMPESTQKALHALRKKAYGFMWRPGVPK